MYSSVLEAMFFFSLGFLFQQLSVLGCLTIDNDAENAQFLRERELKISLTCRRLSACHCQ